MSQATTKCMDILTSALEMEERGRRYYEEAVLTCKNPLGREMFTILRDYEVQHVAVIKKIHESLNTGAEWTDDLAECPISSDLGQVFRKLAGEQTGRIGAGASDIQALNVGIDFESNAMKFYGDFAKGAVDPFEKKFAERMLQEERGHLNMLTDMKQYFTDPESWFQEKIGFIWTEPEMPPISIMIGGEAGQGLATIGQLLVKSLTRAGYRLLVAQDYLSQIRGGHNTFAIRAGDEAVLAPCESVDLLLALNEETVRLHRGQLSDRAWVVTDDGVRADVRHSVQVPFKSLSESRFFNIAVLGAAGAILGLEKDIVASTVRDAFGRKHPEAMSDNLAALDKAYGWFAGRPPFPLRLSPVEQVRKRLALDGNEAIALGAAAAGVRFCAFYPMTPATTVSLTLAGFAKQLDLVVEQAEDEIAAVNMALGASYAGAPSMVATSGGGFALMQEGVSLAAMTETPLVVVVVQRPGPATGLPTRTEQADLDFVLHSGHGEFPRAIFAPGDVEQCFHLTRRAFDLAERYQGPIFLLSDQFLADSQRAVEPFDLQGGPTVDPKAAHDRTAAGLKSGYRRFALVETGVSPRLLPGLSEHLVVAGSDEHTEDGRLTEDLGMRIAMNEKRLNKAGGLKAEALPPDYLGDERPDVLLVCWGSTRGSALEAAEMLREDGRRAAVLHFSQVWPLVSGAYMDEMNQAGRVVGVESNAFGQFARLFQREIGFPIPDRILRYDGLPITPEYILRGLAEMGA